MKRVVRSYAAQKPIVDFRETRKLAIIGTLGFAVWAIIIVAAVVVHGLLF